MGAVPSSLHQKVKFSTEQGIAEVRGDQGVARRCQVAVAEHRKEEKSEPAGQL